MLRKRVLIADDDREMRGLVRQLLESLDVEVQEVESGAALVSHLADADDFDLVVTDVLMPWLSGSQAVRMARSAGFRFPVMVITAFADHDLKHQISRIQGARLVEKPFDPDDFIAKAQEMLGIAEPAVTA